MNSYEDSPSDYTVIEDMSDVLDDYQSVEKEELVEEFEKELEEVQISIKRIRIRTLTDLKP